MDAQHDGTHLTFALGMLHGHGDTKNISFGFVNKDGSVHPEFRLLAVDHIPSKSKFIRLDMEAKSSASN